MTPPNPLIELAERGTFAGMRVFVARPLLRTRQRGWKERWFTFPWRPFQRVVSVLYPAAVPADECYRVGNDLHCGENFYEKIRSRAASESPHG